MSAIINTILPPRGFELIRDRIAVVLKEEFENQLLLTGDYELDLKVFAERNAPYDHTELSCINVSLAQGNYGNKNMGYKDGTYQFHVDVYTNSKSKQNQDGTVLSLKKLHRLMGVSDSILEDARYRTLGFANPFISRTFVSKIDIAQGAADAFNSSMGRITFNVVASELNPFIEPNLIDGYETTVKIDTFDVGYFWQGGIIVRVTEDGLLRLTEVGERRILE